MESCLEKMVFEDKKSSCNSCNEDFISFQNKTSSYDKASESINKIEENYKIHCLPLVNNWTIKKFQSLNNKSKINAKYKNHLDSFFIHEKVKTEDDENNKRNSTKSMQDINNSPYSIRNLTSHLNKKTAEIPLLTPLPKYTDYTYITNSQLVCKYLSSQLAVSNKFQDYRASSGFLFPSYSTRYFSHNWPKHPFKSNTLT